MTARMPRWPAAPLGTIGRRDWCAIPAGMSQNFS
jgi:hypothetical protein